MWPAILYLVTAAASAPGAEPVDARLEDTRVEMVLNTPGRTGACDVLRFTPDGKHLLAAGDDKVVRVWDCGDGGLSPAAVPALRWNIFREHRGGIYALDVAADPDRPGGFRVAVAGVGLRNADAAVLDSRGKVVFALPPFAPGKQREEARTVGAIWSVAFAPGGQRVALGASDGSVWLWDIRGKAVRRLGSHPGRPGARPGAVNRVLRVAFLGEDRLLSVAADGWALQWNLRDEASEPRRLFRFERAKNLEYVAIDPTKAWLAAGGQRLEKEDVASSVEVRSLDGARRKYLNLPAGHFPKRLAFDAASRRLAVATYVPSKPPSFYLILGGGTYLFDLTEDKPRAVPGPKTSWYVDAVAFHPDSQRFAVAGGDDQEVTLWDLRQPNEAVSRIAGPGKGLWGVGVSKDFRYLGYRDQRNPTPDHPNHLGRGVWGVFDLKQRRFAPPEEAERFEPVAPLDTADGWSVEPDAVDGKVWYVAKGTGRHRVPLMRMDEFPRCYTFLKADEDRPTRLVVGHLWGMSVFALGKDAPRLVRKFAGHQGEVMAVAPSADGHFLVTASRDQTVAFWSLLPHRHQGELGASFEARAGRLTVTAVAPGSPAWEARLERGDEVTGLAADTAWLKGGPGEWLQRLRDPAPGRELAFLFDRRGVGFATVTTVRQRPLARLFPMSDREWVLSRGYDYYYDCSTNGDRFVAWQLTDKVDATPHFDPLERYRKVFYKPEKIEALFANLKESPDRVTLADIEPPHLAFAAGPDKLVDGAVRVTIDARAAGDRPEQRLEQVNLWVNGALVQEWTIDDTKFLTFYDVPAEQLRRGTNLLTVQAYNRADVRRQADARVEYIRPQTHGDLYALVIGVGDYGEKKSGGVRGPRGLNLPDLSAGKDALAVEQILSRQRRLFANINIVTLRDQDASRDRVLKETARLAKLVRPDDTFVLFLGGHGASGKVINVVAGERGLPLEQKLAPHLFVFCTHDFTLDRPLATGLPSEDLYREIRRLNCRTVVLLDACHSGTIIEDPVRQLTPEGVGPVILSACEPREPAAEDRVLGLRYTQGRANGLFTIALVLGLGREFPRADADHDGRLTAAELDAFLRHRVPELLRNSPGGTNQHPTGWLPALEKEMPLAAR